MRSAVLALSVAAVAVGGCATKRYPIATPMTAAEAEAMDCDDLKLERIRAEAQRRQIQQTARPDVRSAAGLLGDFGIGNTLARDEASRANSDRLNTIIARQAALQCPRS